MKTFADVMSTNPSRLVVMFQRDGDNSERFQWGVVGSIPVLTLIGSITRIQSELVFRSADPCDQQAFVLAWDKESKIAHWFVHPNIPIDPLVGMLETIKAMLVDSRLAQQAAANQTRIVGLDGQPMRGI